MIGSLCDFIRVSGQLFQKQTAFENQEDRQETPQKQIERKDKSALQNYVPNDKTELLLRFEKNSRHAPHRKRIVSLGQAKKVQRKPLVEHSSFFVQADTTKDEIAQKQLKRKHNLLRAMVRMKQSEQEPTDTSEYANSFQRLYQGFSSIHPRPLLEALQNSKFQTQEFALPKLSAPTEQRKARSSLNNRKRIQYEHCLNWAKKHHKNGDFFAIQLGKEQSASAKRGKQTSVTNRSIIQQIERQLGSSYLS